MTLRDKQCSGLGRDPGIINDLREVGTSNPLSESLEGFLDVPLNNVPYRAYMETTPQYIPAQGIGRYMPSLRNLIPVRKSEKIKGSIAVDEAGFFSFVFYTWLSPFIYRAYRRGLTHDDIPLISSFDSCDLNAQRLESLWQQEVAKNGVSDASFGYAVWKFIRTRVMVQSLLFSLSLLMGFISPTIFMRYLLKFAENKESRVLEGVLWAICLVGTDFLRLLLFSWSWAISYRTGIRTRSACLALLYKKVLRLHGPGEVSVGELINIFANDSQRMYDMVLFGHMIIGGPLVSICGVIYIYLLLGSWALLGMATFVLFYPAQYGISHLTSYLRSKIIVQSDKRVKVMTEILNSIKFIKMYAWEQYFNKRVKDIRSSEQNLLQKSSYCQSLSMSLACTVPVISAVVTFLAHITAGNNLSAAQAFPMLSFLNTLLRTSFDHLRIGTSNIYESMVAFPRFKRILCLEDVQPYVLRPINKSEAVRVIDGTFSYHSSTNIQPTQGHRGSQVKSEAEKELLNPEKSQDKYVTVLNKVCFRAPKGQLIGVCGAVGSGKTSLILACLGQMRKSAGQVMRDGSCAYVSQEPWILNATLKENILFGEQFDSKRYYQAIYACSLAEDINILPGGDQTEIGEKGINLSGGQKQRVALARALYANRDIYFLDDPLSAVDAHVGASIFERYIKTCLKDKTVVFVTHQMEYLSSCDEVYMLKEGYIVEQGKHHDLMAKDREYASMVRTSLHERQKEANEENEDSLLKVSSDASVGSARNEQEYLAVNKGESDQLVIPEPMEKGHIKFHTYHSYVSSAGGYLVAFLVSMTLLMNVGSSTFSTWWLAMWIKAGGGAHNETYRNNNLLENPDYPVYRNIYAITVAVILGTSLLRGFVFTKATLRASTRTHNKLFYKIIHCPMLFFETTPIGRLQNLFSRDLDEVDARLPAAVESLMQNILILLFAILLICLVFPWFIIPMSVLACIYYFISKIFRVAVRDLKRLETVSRSPIYSWVGTTVVGLNTIHAFDKENEFNKHFTRMFDENSTCLYLCNVAGRWLALRMDNLAVVITCITSSLVILLHGQVPPAMAGLALAYSAHISGLFQYTIRLMSDTEVRFISIERMNGYLQNVVSEGSLKPSMKPPVKWPGSIKGSIKGSIRFQNVSLSYRNGQPDVLKDISFCIDAGEKVGIVGRTGAGKSSLIVALFRLVELSAGNIKIDGIDIADLDLDKLRSKLTVIPQDPVLFAGTIRTNIDPFLIFSDSEIWNALEKTRLKDKVVSVAGQLDATVNESGDNFSVGERQLFCLARALLKKTKILVLDEATAAVDPETEAVIQKTIQTEFLDCTVLTIAHRLSTVTSSDRVLVMDQGKVAEFEKPSVLLDMPGSLFYQLSAAAEKAVNRALHCEM